MEPLSAVNDTEPKRARLREKKHARKDGGVTTYYSWDGRRKGLGEVPLGTEKDSAIKLWNQLESGIYTEAKILGKSGPKTLAVRQVGKRRAIPNAAWNMAEPWMRTMFLNAERRASVAKRAFTITPSEFIELCIQSEMTCAVSGITFDSTGKNSPFAPSLDRIDSARGYEPGNVRLVCHIANVAMNKWGLEHLIKLSKAVLRKYG